MASSTLKWFGAEVAARIVEAEKAAIDETTEEAAEVAVRDRWWKARQGEEGLVSQVITAPARVEPTGAVSGKFGSTRRQGFYGLILEYKRPWIRPAGDEVFPTLHARLREKVAELK